jgi:hypothetical protein
MKPLAAFARWYWARVKEIPLVVGMFAVGATYGAVSVEAAHRTPLAIQTLHTIVKARI